jgi:hypothetical protein
MQTTSTCTVQVGVVGYFVERLCAARCVAGVRAPPPWDAQHLVLRELSDHRARARRHLLGSVHGDATACVHRDCEVHERRVGGTLQNYAIVVEFAAVAWAIQRIAGGSDVTAFVRTRDGHRVKAARVARENCWRVWHDGQRAHAGAANVAGRHHAEGSSRAGAPGARDQRASCQNFQERATRILHSFLDWEIQSERRGDCQHCPLKVPQTVKFQARLH